MSASKNGKIAGIVVQAQGDYFEGDGGNRELK